MNTITILTGIFSCLLLMLSIAHSFTLSGKTNDGEHHLLIERPLAFSPGKFAPIYHDEGLMIDDDDENDEQDIEKRRFNAWAGKRSILGKRRFNAWAGRR